MTRLRIATPRNIVVAVALVVVVIAGGLVLTATQADAAPANPGILPATASPYGHTYGEWGAEFWKWLLAQGLYPLVDTTGELCTNGQSGTVWFLAGTWVGDVQRSCTVPAGTALFVPVQNYAWITFPTDPPTPEAEMRSDLTGVLDGLGSPTAELDGTSVVGIDQYRVQSPLFDAYIPADNVAGIPEMDSGPNVDEGWYLMLAPLSVGEHTVTFTSWGSEVSYDLTVVPAN